MHYAKIVRKTTSNNFENQNRNNFSSIFLNVIKKETKTTVDRRSPHTQSQTIKKGPNEARRLT